MAGKSNYLEGQLLSLIFRTQTAWKPSAIYVGLYTAAPSDAGGGTEVSTSGTNYARVQVTQADGNWDAPTGTPRTTQNTNAVTFGAPSANWGTVTHFGIFDATTAGNLLYWGALTQSKTVNNGDAAPSFAAGAIDITED